MVRTETRGQLLEKQRIAHVNLTYNLRRHGALASRPVGIDEPN